MRGLIIWCYLSALIACAIARPLIVVGVPPTVSEEQIQRVLALATGNPNQTLSEARKLGFVGVRKGETYFLYHDSILTGTPSFRALRLTEILINELGQLDYTPGQRIDSARLSEGTRRLLLQYFSAFSLDTPMSPARAIEEGMFAISLDVLLLVRDPAGNQIPLKMNHMPYLSKIAPQLGAADPEWSPESVRVFLNPSSESNSKKDQQPSVQDGISEKTFVAHGYTNQFNLYFSQHVKLDDSCRISQEYFQSLEDLLRTWNEQIQQAQLDLAQRLLKNLGIELPRELSETVPLNELDASLRKLIEQGVGLKEAREAWVNPRDLRVVIRLTYPYKIIETLTGEKVVSFTFEQFLTRDTVYVRRDE